jgi:hypothetical protein
MRLLKNEKRWAIGGDFEFNIKDIKKKDKQETLLHGQKGTWTASGRSALSLILKHLQRVGVHEVLLPSFLCESILQPVKSLGFKYSFYPVGNTMIAQREPEPGAAILIIHYFGWINPATSMLRSKQTDGFYLIEDASQAALTDLSASNSPSRFLLLSPRKFGPLPFGGWCNVITETPGPTHEIEGLVWRSIAARLTRSAYLTQPHASVDPNIEEFYLSAFRAVEPYLDNHPTDSGIPQIILDIMAGLDWAEIGNRRRSNWQCLHELLNNIIEPLMTELPPDVVPLGYVIRLDERDKVRKALAAKRIFCPVHWPLPAEISAHRFPIAAQLSETCLTLPIDQRYGPEEMAYVAQVLKEVL